MLIDLDRLRRTFETNVFGAAAVSQADTPSGAFLSAGGRVAW